MDAYRWINSPLGRICIVADRNALKGLYFEEQKYFPSHLLPVDSELTSSRAVDAREMLFRAAEQINGYFCGARSSFDLPLHWDGTPFQRVVWSSLMDIPFGQTVSYQDIAEKMNMPKATRAVGSAIGRNPISLICPCHRVIASNGNLTGYAGGIDRKRWLLDHEQTEFFRTIRNEPSSVTHLGALV